MKIPELKEVIVVLNFKPSIEKLEGTVWTVVEITKIENDILYFDKSITDIMGDTCNNIAIDDYQKGWFYMGETLPRIDEHIKTL